jgi:catechol 2,3-dioxygenase-like lactoylglutathione lyase family enzyme
MRATAKSRGVVPFLRIDHVQVAIPAESEATARAFYVDLFEFEERPKPPHLAGRGGLWLRSGSVDVHLGVDPDFHAARKAHPALRCANYRALIERLKAGGVEIIDDPHPIGKARHCYVSDPFGNRLELIEDGGR